MGNRLIFALWLLLSGVSCSTSSKVTLNFKKPIMHKEYSDQKAIAVELEIKGAADSIVLTLNRQWNIKLQENKGEIPSESLSLGENVLVAEAYKSGKNVAKKYLLFEVLTNHRPQHWSIEVLRKLHHERDAFTQGLFVYNNLIYETTGERGHSRLITRNVEDGKIIQQAKLSDQYFGEGATVWKDKVYYITWTSGRGFIFDAKTLKEESTFNYGKYTKEGWGLTTVGEDLFMSNGTEKLLVFLPESMQLKKTLSVMSDRGKHTQLNELEYDGKYIYANVWMSNEILAINPKSGRVEAIIDCKELVKQEKEAQKNPMSDVLNGIAYNSQTSTFYLTGKNWDHIYEVKLVK